MLARPEPARTIVSQFVEALNREDADAAAACLAFNCVIATYQGVSQHVGARAAVEALCGRFGMRPKAMTAVANRIVIGDLVAQLEVISAGAQTLDRRLALYTLTPMGQIGRIELARA
jgi:hypothetical protein